MGAFYAMDIQMLGEIRVTLDAVRDNELTRSQLNEIEAYDRYLKTLQDRMKQSMVSNNVQPSRC